MRNDYATRKAVTETTDIVRTRVQSAFLQYLMRNGVGFEPLGDMIRVHRPLGLGTYNVRITACYQDEARTGILVRVTCQPGFAGVRVLTASERSATQRLFNLGHSIVREWDHYLKGATS